MCLKEFTILFARRDLITIVEISDAALDLPAFQYGSDTISPNALHISDSNDV
jgi:hypothetical protein